MNVVYDMLAFQLSLWAANSRRPAPIEIPLPLEASRPAPIEIPPQPVLEAFDDDNVLNMAFIEEGRAACRHSQQKGRHLLFFDE